jgi:hypothetical protein
MIETLGADAKLTTCYVKDLQRCMYKVRKDDDTKSCCDLDSHANTCVAGRNALKISHIDGRTVTVSPFTDEYKPRQGIHISTVAFFWEDPTCGKPYTLVMHKALYFGKEMEHSLINPNQLQDRGLRVEDVPRQFDEKSTHSIFVPEQRLRIPLT